MVGLGGHLKTDARSARVRRGRMPLKAWCVAAKVVIGAMAAAAVVQPIKIGVLLAMTGQIQWNGKQIEPAIKTYVNEKGDTVAGRKIEFILRDDRGAPDNANRFAQELLAQERVSVLTGFGNTPAALSAAAFAAKAKVPQVIMVAAT